MFERGLYKCVAMTQYRKKVYRVTETSVDMFCVNVYKVDLHLKSKVGKAWT